MIKDFRLKDKFVRRGFRPLTNLFMLLLLSAVGCTTTDKSKGGIQFFEGTAQIYNKKKDKTDYASFRLSIKEPGQLRLAAFVGFIGYPLGVLTINGKEAMLVDHIKHRVYLAKDGSSALKKLLKIELQPREIIAAFLQKMNEVPGWSCPKEGHCHKGNIEVKVIGTSEPGQLQTSVNSEKATVSFVYTKAQSGSTRFKQKTPKGYRQKTL